MEEISKDKELLIKVLKEMEIFTEDDNSKNNITKKVNQNVTTPKKSLFKKIFKK